MCKDNRQIFLVTALGFAALVLAVAIPAWSNPSADADRVQPPMVAKHLLVPESNASQTGGPDAAKASRVTFTGVLSTAIGKKALLETGAAAKDGASPAAWYAEGDTVGPYTIKEISANQIVLEGSGETLRLPLYGPDKDRPQPVEVAAGPLDKGQIPPRGAPEGTGQEQGQGQPQTPFGPSSKGTAQGKGVTPPGQTQPPAQGGGAGNPLQQAIERARQGQGTGQGASQGPFPPPAQGSGSGNNPFMDMLRKQQQ